MVFLAQNALDGINFCLLPPGLDVSVVVRQECGRLGRDLATPAAPVRYLATSLAWLALSIIVSPLSTLLLCLLLYTDSLAFTRPSWLAIPAVLFIGNNSLG